MGRYDAQLESPANADTLCVDPLDDVFGRIIVSSLVSHVVVGGGLSRNHKWPVRIIPLTTVPLSASWPRSSETYKRNGRHMHPTPTPVWGSQVTSRWSESFLVVQLATVTKVMIKPGCAGEARGLARRNDVSSGDGPPGGRLPWKIGHLPASTAASRLTCVVFGRHDRRTATQVVAWR